MKNYLIVILLVLIGSSTYAQSTTDPTSPSTIKNDRLDATIICLDAVEAPTKYNDFAKQFINIPSFPKKTGKVSQDLYKKEINNWLIANPSVVGKILIERKKAHDILYGPRPY